MQIVGMPCQRLAWAFALAVAGIAPSSWALPPDGLRVDFSKHGSDWAQGTCSSRTHQSPIDLNELFKPPSADFQYHYEEVLGEDLKIYNDGRFISATLANTSISRIGGLALNTAGQTTWYNVTSIDIKSESEHTFRGKHFPLEIQIVHKPAKFYAQGYGPESVIVSIFVDCANPPKAKEVWPGLLQKEVKPHRPLRLRPHGAAAFVQQSPEESDALMPDPAGEDPQEEVDDDPAHIRMNAEVNFVHTLVEGEDSIGAAPAPAGAGSPGAAPGPAAAVYVPPSAGTADFNPLLQFLVAQEPPDLDWTNYQPTGGDTPFRLNDLLNGGTYFHYSGSQTLPPCTERTLWLVKREILKASTEQVSALYESVHLMSSGAGNYRTGMPQNQRVVDVLSGKEEIPREFRPTTPPGKKPSGNEQKYIDIAKDAITIAKAASDYAKDIDWRIQAGSTAHLKAMEAVDETTPAPTTSAFIPKPPEDQIWATNIMSEVVKNGIKKAMEENIKELVPATASLATSYLRQRLLKKAGFGPPPIGAQVIPVTPMPGVPTFFPPVQVEQPPPVSQQNLTDMKAMLHEQGCDAESNFTGCGNITGLSPAEARAVAQYMDANEDEDEGPEEEESVVTPEDIQQTLPQGVEAVPSDWPDEEAWPGGLPPANWPTGADPNVWPDPNGAKPSGWPDYKWERYRYNWNYYRSRYLPYRSSYSRYSINRRRRISRRSSNFGGDRRRSGFSFGRRRGGGSSRRSSWSRSGRRRRSSSYSSGRRRSSSRSWR